MNAATVPPSGPNRDQFLPPSGLVHPVAGPPNRGWVTAKNTSGFCGEMVKLIVADSSEGFGPTGNHCAFAGRVEARRIAAHTTDRINGKTRSAGAASDAGERTCTCL